METDSINNKICRQLNVGSAIFLNSMRRNIYTPNNVQLFGTAMCLNIKRIRILYIILQNGRYCFGSRNILYLIRRPAAVYTRASGLRRSTWGRFCAQFTIFTYLRMYDLLYILYCGTIMCFHV